MKKFYGPIVLGIAALTVAAPVVNTTTVLADTDAATTGTDDGTTEGTPKDGDDTKATTDKENGKPDTTEPDKDTMDQSEIDLYTSKQLTNLEAFETKLNSFNGTTPTLTALREYVSDQKEALAKAKPTKSSEYDKLRTELNDKNTDLENKITSNSISTYVKDSDNKVKSIIVKNIPLESGQASTGADISKDNAGMTGTLSVDADGKTLTVSSPLSIVTDADHATDIFASDAQITDAQKNIQGRISELKSYTSSDQSALDAMISALNFDLQTLTPNKGNPLSSQAVNDVVKKADDYFDKNTTTISTNDSQNTGFPVIKNATVTLPFAKLSVTFDKDGNLVSATTSDKDYQASNPLKVWIGNYDDVNPSTVTAKYVAPIDNSSNHNNNSNHHNNNSNHHNNPSNNNKPTTKPETKPESTKSISEHQTTFYILPNTLANLFDENGNVLSERALGGNSAW